MVESERKEEPRENQDPELAMRESCDKHGEFKRTDKGMLAFDDYIALRKIIVRQAARMFQPMKKVLNARKLEAYKKSNDAMYANTFKQGAHQQYQTQVIMTAKACEYLNIGAKEYQVTSQVYATDNQRKEVLRMADMVALAGLATKPDLIEEATAIKAYKAKIQRDLDIHRKMNNIRFMVNDKQSAEMTQIEIAKTSDYLMVEYGFALEDLLWNIQKQKLDEKPEISGFKKMFMLQKQTEAKKRAAKCAISEE